MGSKSILVVGAGFAGATVARELAQKNFHVTVIDQRNHVAGNAYDSVNEHGITTHSYGPHIFHTNNHKVFRYLSEFTQWIPYQHQVVAKMSDSQTVVFPPKKALLETLGRDQIIDIFYRPYTEKMWGMPLEQVDPSILDRVSLRSDDSDGYFPKDRYQCLPAQGYTALISRMLEHDNIRVSLNTPHNRSLEQDFYHVFNSMPIDVYYDYCFGALPYRSIKFHTYHVNVNKLSHHPVINFTDTDVYTRMIEWKNFPGHGSNDLITTVTYEQPCDYRENNFERYYPVRDHDGVNKKIYLQYQKIKNHQVTFIGRCGQYVYIDMDQAVANSLSLTRKFLKQNLEIL